MPVGQGLAPTALTDILACAVPPAHRARAVGAVFSGFNVGHIAGLLLSPHIILRFGWRVPRRE